MDVFEGIREAPNIHPLFLHFPLVLLPVALLFWVLSLALRRDELFRAGRWLLYLATASVIAAAWSGFVAENQLGHESHMHDLIHQHKAFMLATAILTVLLCLTAFLLRKRASYGLHLTLTVVLASTVVFMTFGADEGGHAVFGHGIGTRAQKDSALAEVAHPEFEDHEHAGSHEHGDKGNERADAPAKMHDHHDQADRKSEDDHGKGDHKKEHEAAPDEVHRPDAEHQEKHQHQEEGSEPHQGHKAGQPSNQQDHPAGHMSMKGILGLPHTREASGTSWQPDSTPMRAIHFMEEDWTFMIHGNVFAGYDYQSGKRGEDEWISTNWLMLMARRPLGGGELGLRTMLSFEPATTGRDGYPLLLQTGESLGNEPLHDAQHPHDLFMEVAGLYTHPIGDDLAVQLYAAPSGEPALGPTAFPHRMSAAADPLAPLGHHWQDSTHISFGVLTAGLFTQRVKLEGSWFNGREPDENRWDFDLRTPDSYSGRLTFNPNESVSAQVSYGHLKSPEKLEPDISLNRGTASVMLNRPWGDGGNWATTLAWGLNNPERESSTNSFLLETSFELDRHHNPFARLEYLKKSGHDLVLDPALDEETFGIASVALGYVYSFDPIGSMVPGLGFRFSVNFIEDDLEPFYGRKTPYGVLVYFRLWPAKTEESPDKDGAHH